MDRICETTNVDRSGDFDQVSEHNHAAGIKCWCGKWPPPISIPDSAGLTDDDNGRDCRCGTTDAAKHGRYCVHAVRERTVAPADEPCSVCRWVNGHANDCDHFPRYSAIDMKIREDHFAATLRLANDRIRQFETLTQNLAAKFDEIESDFIFLTGKTFGEWLAEFRSDKLADGQPVRDENGILRDSDGLQLCDTNGCTRPYGHPYICNS